MIEITKRWIGGVVRPRGFVHDGKPMRLAVWITHDGTLIDACIVRGHGPTLLRDLLDEVLALAPPEERATELVVWPAVAKAFADLEFPQVEVRRDEFLRIVVEDLADAGQVPQGLRTRCPAAGGAGRRGV